MHVSFSMSFWFTLFELVVYYFMKVANKNLEIDDYHKIPYVASGTAKIIGILSVLVAIGAVALGT